MQSALSKQFRTSILTVFVLVAVLASTLPALALEIGMPNGMLPEATETVCFTGLDVRIPPIGLVGSIINTQNVGLDGTINDVNVHVNIDHTSTTDIDMSIDFNGVNVELSSANGGFGNNFTDTIFDDEAATSITAGVPPFTGDYQPEGNLGDFDGQNANGAWSLHVIDNLHGDFGTLNSWCLIFDLETGEVVGAVNPQGEVVSVEEMPLPPNVLEFWPGNSTSPTFDHRMNANQPADPFVIYCRTGQIQVLSAEGEFLTQISTVMVSSMDPAGTTQDMGAGFTVARANNNLTVGTNDGSFNFDFTLPACLAYSGF